MKVLILGAAGFVGPYLIKEFVDHGYEVFASDIVPDFKHEQAQYFQADITNFESIKDLLAKTKPDYLVNLAAISSVGLSWKMPQKTFEINVVGAINVLEALVQNELFNCKTLIVGSSEEYKQQNRPLNIDDPLDANNPYGVSKIAQEQMADIYASKHGLKIIKVRAFNHTGPGQKDTFVIPSFCKQVVEIEKSGKPGVIKVGNLSAIRDFSDVRDVVAAYRYLLENKNGGVFNVGSGVATSIEAVLFSILKESSADIKIMVQPDKVRPTDSPFVCCSVENNAFPFIHPLSDTICSVLAFFRANNSSFSDN